MLNAYQKKQTDNNNKGPQGTTVKTPPHQKVQKFIDSKSIQNQGAVVTEGNLNTI